MDPPSQPVASLLRVFSIRGVDYLSTNMWAVGIVTLILILAVKRKGSVSRENGVTYNSLFVQRDG